MVPKWKTHPNNVNEYGKMDQNVEDVYELDDLSDCNALSNDRWRTNAESREKVVAE